MRLFPLLVLLPLGLSQWGWSADIHSGPLTKIEHNFVFKITLSGDSGVGKSNLFSRYVQQEFHEESKSTIGVEFAARSLSINQQWIKAQIWDTAGQERFQAMTKVYHRNAKGCILTFDLTQRRTFHNLRRWHEIVSSESDPDVCFLLVGNKSDLYDKREVTEEEAKSLAKELDMTYIETSAKTEGTYLPNGTKDTRIEEGITALVERIYYRFTKHSPSEKTDQVDLSKQKTQQSCCF